MEEQYITKTLNGEGLAKKRRLVLRERIACSRVKPVLGVVLVGGDSHRESYRAFQNIAVHEVGVVIETVTLPIVASEHKIARAVCMMNENKNVHGVLLQYAEENDRLSTNLRQLIDPDKDVDCIHPRNIGLLALGSPFILPSVTHAIWTLIQSANISVTGQHILVIGNDDIIAKPIAMFLMNQQAVVTIIVADNPQLKKYTCRADIIVSCVNIPHFLKRNMINAGAMVIDAGATLMNERIVGDADMDDLRGHVRFVSPVPGGLEALTINALLENAWHIYCHSQSIV